MAAAAGSARRLAAGDEQGGRPERGSRRAFASARVIDADEARVAAYV
jgi:hypothetical protein